MGVVLRYMRRKPGSTLLEYRREYPAHLRPFLTGRQLKVSLGGTDEADPKVVQRWSAANAKYQATVALARKRTAGSFDQLDEKTIARLIATDRYLALHEDEESRFDPADEQAYADVAASLMATGAAVPWAGREQDRRYSKRSDSLETYLALLQADYQRGRFDNVAELAGEIALGHGLHVDAASADYRLFLRSLLVSRIETTKLLLERQQGVPVPTPPAPVREVAASGNHSEGALTLGEAADRFCGFKEARVAPSTRQSYDPTFRLLKGVLGANTALMKISRSDISKVVEALTSLPAGLGKAKGLRGLPIMAAIEKAKVTGLPTISAKTINGTYWATIKTFFRWAKDEGLVEVDPTPSTAPAFDPIAPEDKRDPFTMEQLKVIFGSAPWSPRDEEPSGQPIRFWGPLIALFMGLRRGEIAQLRVQDFSEVDGVPVMHVAADSGLGGRRGKTRAARRRLPVHPELVKIGLLRFVSRQRNAKADLWPGEGPNGRGQWGDGFGDWFGRLLESRRVVGRKLGLHSFRHNFEDRLREIDAHGSPIGRALAGRSAGGDASAGYGSGHSTAKLHEIIQKVAYPEVSFEHLHQTD